MNILKCFRENSEKRKKIALRSSVFSHRSPWIHSEFTVISLRRVWVRCEFSVNSQKCHSSHCDISIRRSPNFPLRKDVAVASPVWNVYLEIEGWYKALLLVDYTVGDARDGVRRAFVLLNLLSSSPCGVSTTTSAAAARRNIKMAIWSLTTRSTRTHSRSPKLYGTNWADDNSTLEA